MEKLTRKIHNKLIEKGRTIAVAESCTGGLLSSRLTSISGSSNYFLLGIVSYSNNSKLKILKIQPQVLLKLGAVSQETAKAMAESVRKLAHSDIGIGITGIAGPTGACPNKPVGTVFISLSNNRKTICKKFRFFGSRAAVRKNAVLEALKLLNNIIIKI